MSAEPITPVVGFPSDNTKARSGLASAIALVVLAMILLRTAWISDDAYITFRTVDNLIHGYGLTWNIAERVQAFTNPLWLFLLAPAYALTHEVYFTSLALCMAVSLAAAAILTHALSVSVRGALLGMAILTFSKAFTDYSTSGLENPLTHLLLSMFCVVYLRRQPTLQNLFWLALITSLAALNRMDTILLFLPALTFAFFSWPIPKVKGFWTIILGCLPFAIWEFFSLWYYGFLFPNTAYAKLNTGISPPELIQQGFVYFINSLTVDPLTLTVIAAGLAVTAWFRKWSLWALEGGVLLYLLYVLRIGGDFMSGRFLAAPLFAAVILVSQYPLDRHDRSVDLLFLAVALLGLSTPYSPVLSRSDYERNPMATEILISRGINDERGYYYQGTGLLRANRASAQSRWPDLDWVSDGARARQNGRSVIVTGSVGLFGFYAGPQVHIVDEWALADPLLARLPAEYAANWHIGHFARRLPDGYLDTLQTGQNVIRDKNLAAYYDQLALITRGGLWDTNRLVAIWKMNTGQFSYLIDTVAYRYGPLDQVALADVSEPKAVGTPLSAADRQFTHGLRIVLGRITHAPRLEISLDNNDDYLVVFVVSTSEQGEQVVKAQPIAMGGLNIYQVNVPSAAVESGFDQILVIPMRGDGVYGLGHLRLSP